MAEEKALRYNKQKRKWSLVHFKSLEPMIQVLEFGAEKYAPDNWKKPMDRKELLECLQRHVAALMDAVTDQDKLDPESLIDHIGHVQCNAMFYAYHHLVKKEDALPKTIQELPGIKV